MQGTFITIYNTMLESGQKLGTLSIKKKLVLILTAIGVMLILQVPIRYFAESRQIVLPYSLLIDQELPTFAVPSLGTILAFIIFIILLYFLGSIIKLARRLDFSFFSIIVFIIVELIKNRFNSVRLFGFLGICVLFFYLFFIDLFSILFVFFSSAITPAHFVLYISYFITFFISIPFIIICIVFGRIFWIDFSAIINLIYDYFFYRTDLINGGINLANQGKYEEAIKSYNKAIEINSIWPAAWYWKGNALLTQGKYKEANQAYEKAISYDLIHKETIQNFNDTAFRFSTEGMYETSWKYYQMARYESDRIDYSLTETDLAQSWYGKGWALKALGRTTEADEAFSKAKDLGYKEE